MEVETFFDLICYMPNWCGIHVTLPYPSFFADLLPENCVEEKTKSFDPNGLMAEIKHGDRPGVQLKYSHVSPLELDKFLEDVK